MKKISADLHQRLAALLKEPRIWPQEAAVFLLGLSGGPDSLALLRLLAALFEAEGLGAEGAKLIACHFEHGWRPEAAAAESRFCREVAEALGLAYEEMSAGELKRTFSALNLPENALGETAARLYRRAFFDVLMEKYSGLYGLPVYLVLAHQREDRAETLLLNIFRGCGLRGLAAMPARDGTLLRPLLEFSKQELLDYLAELGQDYLEDESNARGITPRNRLRLEVFPLLEEIFGKPVERLSGLAGRMERLERALDELAAEYLPQLSLARADLNAEIACLSISKAALAAVPELLKAQLWPLLLRPFFAGEMDLGAAHLAILEQAENNSTSAWQPFFGGSLLAWDAHELRLWKPAPDNLQSPALYSCGGARETARPPLLLAPLNTCFKLEAVQDEKLKELWILIEKAYEVSYNSLVRMAAAAALEGCCWRTRRSGDVVRLADGHRKSLKKFMSEQGFPAELRGQMLVLAKASEVLWLPGYFREWRALPEL